MSTTTPVRNYGAYFYELSPPQRLAATHYIDELAKHYPDLAGRFTAGPGNDGEVYVYAPLPEEDELGMEIDKTATRITSKILLHTGISIILMPE